MMGFTQFLNRHARAIYLLLCFVVLAGYLAYQNLASDVYPPLSFPRIAVIANLGDMSPERVLLSLTRPLEEACSQVYGVRWIRSKTIRGATEISVDFQQGTDMIFSLHQVQARIAEMRNRLPPSTSLTIELVTPAIFPVLSYNISSDSLTQADLYSITRYQILPGLTRVAGVSRAQLQGGDVPEFAVEVDAQKLNGDGLSLSQVADALGRANQVQVVGKLDTWHQQNLVVANDEANTPQEMGNIVVAMKAGSPIYLKDVATVSSGFADRTSLVSVHKRPGIVVNIFRQPTANVLAVSRGVSNELEKLRSHLPMGVTIKPAYDESSLVRSSIANVQEAIQTGIILIIVVLLVFLRSWRSTLIAAITIPLSALAVFSIMYLLGQSLNLMSLGGLAVAIGLVIDDAIVVVENIDRQLHMTSDSLLAVSRALDELIGPVTSSTLTTVVVFLPLIFLSGVPGQFFTSLTVTLSAAVLFSLLLALTVTPLLSAQLLGRKKARPAEDGSSGSNDDPKQEENFELPESKNIFLRIYGGLLRLFLKMPIIAVILSAGLCYFGFNLYQKLPSDFLPSVDEGSYVLDYFAPPGSSLEQTDKYAVRLEEIVSKTPEVKTWTRRTGAELGLFATQTNRGDLLVVLKPASQRKRSIDEIMETQREEIAGSLPQLEVEFHQILQDQLNDLSGAPAPVEVRIFGEDPDKLLSIARSVSSQVEGVKGLVDIATTSRQAAPEIEVHVDPLKAGRIGLAPGDVSKQLQDALAGRVATEVKSGDRLIGVRVRLSDTIRLNPEKLSEIPIFGVNGTKMLPLYAVANIRTKAGESEIYCENQQRYVSVSAALEKRDLGSAVREVETLLKKVQLPTGYSMEVAGLFASQQETFRQLLFCFGLASSLVYLLLVIQFRSWIQPIAIFIAVPLSLVGVCIGLKLTNTALNVSSFMGMILLIGLVVKNGIILLEYANRLRNRGIALDDALIGAGKIRLRPILMTTICTLLGLLPLAFGFGAGAELQKPLAIAVISGLSISTLFTLLFVPTIFRLFAGAGGSPSKL
jgi:CzcA family heavy metal efflux pump